MPHPKRVFIYARVSTRKQAEKHGVTYQLAVLRDYAQRNNWAIEQEFIDEGSSGSLKHRPGLDEMMVAIKKRRCDIVVVWRFDRLARSVSHLVEFLSECDVRNIEFVSFTEGVDTRTPIGKALFVIAGAFAELESALARERVQAGIDAYMAKGGRIGRERHALTQDQYLDAIDRYGGIRAAARGLTEELGLTTPISPSTVSRRSKEA